MIFALIASFIPSLFIAYEHDRKHDVSVPQSCPGISPTRSRKITRSHVISHLKTGGRRKSATDWSRKRSHRERYQRSLSSELEASDYDTTRLLQNYHDTKFSVQHHKTFSTRLADGSLEPSTRDREKMWRLPVLKLEMVERGLQKQKETVDLFVSREIARELPNGIELAAKIKIPDSVPEIGFVGDDEKALLKSAQFAQSKTTSTRADEEGRSSFKSGRSQETKQDPLLEGLLKNSSTGAEACIDSISVDGGIKTPERAADVYCDVDLGGGKISQRPSCLRKPRSAVSVCRSSSKKSGSEAGDGTKVTKSSVGSELSTSGLWRGWENSCWTSCRPAEWKLNSGANPC